MIFPGRICGVPEWSNISDNGCLQEEYDKSQAMNTVLFLIQCRVAETRNNIEKFASVFRFAHERAFEGF